MEDIVYSLNLDLRKNSHQVLIMKEDDANSRVIKAVITDNGKPYDLGDYIVNLKWKKPDGHLVYADTENIDNNTIKVICTEQMLAVAGIAEAEFELINSDVILSTLKFTVSINETIISDKDIESSDEFSALKDVLVKSDEIKSHINDESIHKTYIDRAYPCSFSSKGTNLVTERTVFYGTPSINDSYYSHSTTIYAPYTSGTLGYTLHSNGGGAPSWVNIGEVVTRGYGEFVSGSSALTWLEAGYTLTPGTWIIHTNMYMSGGASGNYNVQITNSTLGGILDYSARYFYKPSEGTRCDFEWIVIVELESSYNFYPACISRPDTGSSSYYYSFTTNAIRIK